MNRYTIIIGILAVIVVAVIFGNVSCTDQSSKDYTQTIKSDSTDASYNKVNVYNNRGLIYAALGQYQEAIHDYNQAIELDPNHLYAYNNRGVAYAALGQYQEAIHDYNQAIELNPTDMNAYYNRGLSWFKLGEYKQAIWNHKRVIEFGRGDSDVYFSRGLANEMLGKYIYALSDFDQALRLDSSNVLARSGKIRVNQILRDEKRQIE